MTERRVLLAAALSAIFLAWYAQFLARWAKQAQPQPSQAATQPLLREQVVAQEPPRLSPGEEVAIIASDELVLEIGERTGAVRAATLKRYALRVAGASPLFGVYNDLRPLELSVVERGSDRIVLESRPGPAPAQRISYTVDSHNILCDIQIDNPSLVSTWVRGDAIANSNNQLEILTLYHSNGRKLRHRRFIGEHKTARNVPRGTVMLTLAERHFCQTVRASQFPESVTILPGNGAIAALAKLPGLAGGQDGHQATIYMGPRDHFIMKAEGVGQAFPIGMMGQLGLGLLVALSWIAGWTKNYGIAIIVFSVVTTCCMAPFTLMSFRSMKKMQELKPQIDKLMAKHKDDPKRANAEVFALYRTHRVNPMSGCLPMFLQLPIFFALFQAISHFIELRGKPFLWIQDLSLPDRLATLPIALPILGNELNALPIIMAAAMYLQTKISQRHMPATEGNPTAKLFSGPLMSILFGVMFYHIPSGLVLYWLTNSLTSMAWYLLAK